MEFAIAIVGIWLVSFLLYALIDFVVLAIYVIWSLSLSRLFSKIGEDSWKAYIPFYNIYIVIKAAELPLYYTLGCLLPILGRLGWVAFYIFILYISVMLAKKFGKEKKFLTNVIIAAPLYLMEMGKDNSVYKGNYKKEKEDNNG